MAIKFDGGGLGDRLSPAKPPTMGQYYRIVFLSDDGKIIKWTEPEYGVKMMEHAYVDGEFMRFIESTIFQKPVRIVWAGDYADKEPVIDDYETTLNALKQIIKHENMMRYENNGAYVDCAKEILKKKVGEALSAQEKDAVKFALDFKRHNLYHICDEVNHHHYIAPKNIITHYKYKYIINHTKKEYVDMTKLKTDVHPLPLLTYESASWGGGDYRGRNEGDMGYWARHLISTEEVPPADYVELVTDFCEE